MTRVVLRTLGPLIGAAAAVAAFGALGGLWGMIAGAGVFLAFSTLSEFYWRRGATREDIRRDLEDRVRNPPS